jgi:hypothetical protein
VDKSTDQVKIDLKVRKNSGKPFKSGLKINTVKDIVKHPLLGTDAFTFIEDDSIVEVRQCEEINLTICEENYDTIQ